MNRTPARSNFLIPMVVLLLGLLITAFCVYYMDQTIERPHQARLEQAVATFKQRVENRIKIYEALLSGGRGFFTDDSEVTREEFHRFIEVLEIEKDYPEIQGIGFSSVVQPWETTEIEKKMQEQGNPDFEIWPDWDRQEYHSILYLAPEDARNREAIGYDMGSDEVRKQAMISARDAGEAAMSDPVILVQEIDKEKLPGFLIYVPVYEDGITPETVQERRRKLEGYVYGVFRAPKVFENLVSTLRIGRVFFQVHDGRPADPGSLLYASDEANSLGAEADQISDFVPVTRQTWTIVAGTLPDFGTLAERSVVWVTAVTGVLITCLLFTLSWSQMRSRRSAEVYAVQLKESQERLSAETREARQARADAVNANRLKDEFLATVSHELRTPLNAIMGWSDLLLSDPQPDPEVQHGLEVIRRNVRAQSQLVDDLLDISRITSGRLRLNIRKANPREAMEAAIESVRPSAEAKKINLRTLCSPDVPVISADPARLQQIAWNLLTNAIKFSPENAEIVSELRMDGNRLIMQVTDHGEGIEPEFLPYIFNAFRQADASVTRKHAGLGLGLSIVKHLVEMHGGTIEVTSEGKGAGAVFTVELPAGTERLTEVPTEKNGRDSATGEACGKPGRILEGHCVLVVDDEPDARELLRTVLERQGAEVLTASSADEAIRLFARERPGFVVSDIGMPGGDGYDLIRQIRTMERSSPGFTRATPALALTAFASTRARTTAMGAGFTEHLPKPVSVPDFLEMAERLCAKSVAGRGTALPGAAPADPPDVPPVASSS